MLHYYLTGFYNPDYRYIVYLNYCTDLGDVYVVKKFEGWDPMYVETTAYKELCASENRIWH